MKNITHFKVNRILVLIITICPLHFASGQTIYVDVNATGANNGSSWTNAYKYLQNAFTAALSGDSIWVAQGTYWPDRDTSHPSGTSDPNATFQLKNGVAIYGGFPAGGGIWSSRDPNIHKTILTGDLADNDVYVSDPCNLLTEPTRADNSLHVVTGNYTNATAVIDGFTIKAGHAEPNVWPDREGGGMFNRDANCTINNCTFVENSARAAGGAMMVLGGDSHISNCTFFRNASSGDGGGIKFYRTNHPVVVDCNFISNKAYGVGSGGVGGGLYIDENSSSEVINCLFSNNLAVCGGGVNTYGSTSTFTNCSFIGNYATDVAGGMSDEHSSSNLTNCSFSSNLAVNAGGVRTYGCQSTYTNCTFIGNSANVSGGGMGDENSSLNVTNCSFSNNLALYGGGVSSGGGTSEFTNCSFNGNSSAGLNVYYANPTLTNCTFGSNGDVWIVNNSYITLTDCNFSDNSESCSGGFVFYGAGSATLTNCTVSSNSAVSCDTINIDSTGVVNIGAGSKIKGAGYVNIGFGGEMIVDYNAVVDLIGVEEETGTIQCDGLLDIKGSGQLTNATLNISRQGDGYFGMFKVEDSAQATNLDIYSDGDRFMEVDPWTFTGLIQNNRIYVTISEGIDETSEGLLEVRGLNLEESPCENQVCQINSELMPVFDTSSWTLERLELLPGAKLNLVDLSNSGNGYPEVLYVKDVVLGDGCVLNIGSEHLYYTNLFGDPNLIEKVSILGFSLGRVDCDSNAEFQDRVNNNNFIDPADPNKNRIYVERVTGLGPDPNGMMKISNLQDPCTGKTISARAKIEFEPSIEDEIRVHFDYLFNATYGSIDPKVQIVAYLSDVPEILEANDPCRALHYLEVGRVSAPPMPRPGSAGSNRFGNFEEMVSTGELDLSKGTWLEFVLIEPATGGYYKSGNGVKKLGAGFSAYMDNISADTPCKSECDVCLDLDDDCDILPSDFLAVVSGTGENDTPICVDGALTTDGYTNSCDTASWDWTMNDFSRLDLCGRMVPLRPTTYSYGGFSAFGGVGKPLNLTGLSDLLISGKRGTTDSWTKMKDRLYVFDSNYQYKQYITAAERCSIRIVRDEGNTLYQVNSENGVRKLDPNVSVVGPGVITWPNCPNEPRYNRHAKVYVGMQGSGVNSFGRPILDAAFDANYLYVVPVVVEPNGNEANTYTAAAKIQLDPCSYPPYHIVKFYDGSVLPGDNQIEYRNNLREIELDSAGSVYITNNHALNACDILWKFEPNGTVRRLELDPCDPCGLHIRAPAGLCVSSATNRLYLTSSQCGLQPNSTVIYGFSTAKLTPVRTITVFGMQHITGITEDPVTKALWVAGFSFDYIPDRQEICRYYQYALPFYKPYLAKVPVEPNDINVTAVNIYGAGASDLAMPLSICWTGARPAPQEKCGGADLSGDGNVNMLDFAKLAAYWLNTNCASLNNCNGADLEPETIPDGDVDIRDLDVFTVHWLNTGCL